MKNAYQQQHEAELTKILAATPKDAEPFFSEFLRQFYAKMPVSDLEHFSPKQAVAIAHSAFSFLQSRKVGEPKIRIFTPKKKTHGYDSASTIIELVNDDMPFLIDSLSAELARHSLTIRETLHPIFKIVRGAKGEFTSLAAEDDKNVKRESLIHFEVSPLPETLTPEQLIADLEWVLSHVRASVDDWQKIVAKAKSSTEKLAELADRFDAKDVHEVQDFFRWITNNHFIFLGYAEYDLFDERGQEIFRAVPKSALGILKITDDIAPRGLEAISPEMRKALLVPQLIEVTKGSRRSPVHRPVPMDYIGIKRFDAKGKVIGEIRFVGLFTSTVYYQSTDSIPLVRRKVVHVMKRADFDPVSHDGKSLKTILEFLPRDELLQMSEDEMFEAGMGILALEAKPGVRLFVRKDMFERFVSCMVFVPREQFSTELRHQIQGIIEKAYGGATSSFSTQITEAPLARLHLIIKTLPGDIPRVNLQTLEQEIAKRAYLWSDLLLSKLIAKHGEDKAQALHHAYATAFPQSYINRYDVAASLYDISKIEGVYATSDLALDLYRDRSEGGRYLHLKIYNPNEEIALSDILPMLENAGFRVVEEHPYLISPQGHSGPVWVRDFRLQAPVHTVALDTVKPLLEEVMLKVWRGEMESDRFNALVLRAELTAAQITMLRAYAKYLKQAGFAASQPAIEQALGNYPDITGNIAKLFAARFDPEEKKSEEKQTQIKKAIEEQLAAVTSAADDRILRRYVDLISATLRTNYYQAKKSVLSFKFNSALVPDLPLPWPYAEIFVYSPRVEGIHLRGGKVARGGLRWSDRHDDFRTEVLGLMKAQMVKNSVIVPVGSKGGFVVKRPPQSREALMEEGISCYKLYLSGLLDLTDNIVGTKVVPPKQLIRQDGDDPYLVVAADKGTATFSDIANGVSEEYGFWLGDAFASGGSVGYDHKKMAITARGGWVSVTRHFQEMGVDIAKQDFTCVGIGDMSGDVFGNGMLLSDRIKLLAAFNHLHIFIDPNPDTKVSFKERKRLFNLSRSTWKDYDDKLISKGGGIFDRSAKSIEISKEAQTALGLSKMKYAPDDLIRALVLAPADLLWNGGIGTYVKAEDETHDQVGDRTNNAVRVNGKDLRCKVVGEGGNLGFTQKGRIEYARAGGRINTDAIDNSAGVDCSDHEVNIKIAFAPLLASGKLSLKDRNKILVGMTDEVAELVLKDNILQTQAITIAEHQGASLLESQARMMHTLEQGGLLNRAIEFLPNDAQLAELKAARRGLTRPSIAVLLAYAKMELYKQLIETTLPDESYFAEDLKRYFPEAMRKDFSDIIGKHRLKREIIATVATNSMVNRAGITFFFDLAEDSGASTRDIVAAYSIARDAFLLRDLWNEIEEIAPKISAGAQADMYGAISRFLERVTVWLLRNKPLPLDIDATAKELLPAVADLEKHKLALHSETTRHEAEKLTEKLMSQGVSQELAEHVSNLKLMASAFDIIAIARASKKSVKDVGKIYFTLGSRLGLSWLRLSGERIATANYWERLAVQALVGDLYDEQRRLVTGVLSDFEDVEAWTNAHADALTRYDRFLASLKGSDAIDAPRLMVALRHVRGLAAV
jgi:glutamate dehydrogenase